MEKHKEKEKLKRQERFFFYLFWFLIFLIIFGVFKYFYDLKTQQLFYKGKYGVYYYDAQGKTWNLNFAFNNQTYIVPFEMHPREFENVNITLLNKYNNMPDYIILAYRNNTNLSYIVKSTVNLGRILNVLGYISFYYLYPAYLIKKNNTLYVEILNRNLSKLSEGPLECNMRKALFIILEPESNESKLIFNGSCIYVKGKGLNFSREIDKLTLVFMDTLYPSPLYRENFLKKVINKTNNKNVRKSMTNLTNETKKSN